MKPNIFVFLVSVILLILLIKILLSKPPLLYILQIFVIISMFMIFTIQYAIIYDKKQLLEIPHLWMHLTVIITTLLVNDKRIINFNIILLVITILSRFYYNGCAINIVGYKEKKVIPKVLMEIQREIESKLKINSTHIYGVLLLINIYKLYVN